jgi:hypothetical protein
MIVVEPRSRESLNVRRHSPDRAFGALLLGTYKIFGQCSRTLRQTRGLAIFIVRFVIVLS